jgi:hypothetical protein
VHEELYQVDMALIQMRQILQATVTANHTNAGQLQMHQAGLVLVHAAITQSEAPKLALRSS